MEMMFVTAFDLKREKLHNDYSLDRNVHDTTTVTNDMQEGKIVDCVITFLL